MQTVTFNLRSAKYLFMQTVAVCALVFLGAAGSVHAAEYCKGGPIPEKTHCSDGWDNQCNDGKDWGLGFGKGDGKADYYGVDTNNDGQLDLEPDPACVSANDGSEESDDVAKGSLIPCTNKCTLSDVFKLINGLLSFFIKALLIPIFIILLMYAGFKYITAEGNPAKKADLQKMFGNMVKGLILVLCAWLIVRTILSLLGYTEGLLFFG